VRRSNGNDRSDKGKRGTEIIRYSSFCNPQEQQRSNTAREQGSGYIQSSQDWYEYSRTKHGEQMLDAKWQQSRYMWRFIYVYEVFLAHDPMFPLCSFFLSFKQKASLCGHKEASFSII